MDHRPTIGICEPITGQSAETIASFGPFRLHFNERRMERDGLRVPMTARAMDILIELIARAGSVVSKYELLDKIWPGIAADEGYLRVYVAALRKALGDGKAGARYVATVSGQGYCFVADVCYSAEPRNASEGVIDQSHSLPERSVKMVGRDRTVPLLANRLIETHFVTLVGPGGIGKTTVAIAVGYELLSEYAGAVRFVDLGTIHDAALVPNAIASALGLLGIADDPTDGLVAFLSDKRMLLILDCCEHVIETVAGLTERLFRDVPNLCVLATSREALRVEGEHVHRLQPLDCPPDQIALTASQALAFPAVQLFVERAAANDSRFALDDANANLVGEICRRLDGIALAIELASSRAGEGVLDEPLSLLNTRFDLLEEMRKTTLPRHQTLRATLDWSYNLLSNTERQVLCRLSVFVGPFSLEAAQTVAVADEDDPMQIASALGSLVAKSLLNVSPGHRSTKYRLLDATRAYVAEQLKSAGESNPTALRHASYFLHIFERTGGEAGDEEKTKGFTAIADQIGNVRGALTWCFGATGNLTTGVALAAASMPMFLELSLLAECQLWARRAIKSRSEVEFSQKHDLHLHAALGLATMHARGNSDSVLSSLTKALEIAEQVNDVAYQLQLLERLHVFHLRRGEYADGRAYAERALAVASGRGNAAQRAQMQIALGASLHLAGETSLARSNVESALLQLPPQSSPLYDQLNFDYLSRGRLTLSRILWIQGFSDQAVALARQALAEVVGIDHPAKVSMAVVWGFTTFVWNREADACEEYVDKLRTEAQQHLLGPYKSIGEGARGVVLMAKGRIDEGLAMVQSAMRDMRRQNFRPYADLNLPVAETLASMGRYREALAMIDEAKIEAACVMPEVYRIRAEVLLAAPDPDVAEAQECLIRSLQLARSQSALSWELRTATSFAKLKLSQDRPDEARKMLAPVYARLTEGFHSHGVIAARDLLSTLTAICPDSCAA